MADCPIHRKMIMLQSEWEEWVELQGWLPDHHIGSWFAKVSDIDKMIAIWVNHDWSSTETQLKLQAMESANFFWITIRKWKSV